MRIPIWPGIRVSLFVRQDPERVQVTMATYYKPLQVLRVASFRGWMLLSVRYDWKDAGRYATKPLDTPENGAWHSIWLHGDWKRLTMPMTTPQKDYAAACVEAYSRHLAAVDGDPDRPGPDGLRWWRD